MFNITEVNLISNINQTLLTIMLGVIIILPFGMRFFTSRGENIVPVYRKRICIYLAGIWKIFLVKESYYQ